MPLGLVLPIVFASSVGTGAVTLGIFFLTRQGLGFSIQQNYLLGTLMGAGYIAAAFGAGPIVTRWTRRRGVRGMRGVLIAVLAGLGLVCQLPVAVRFAGGDPTWTPWVLVAIYGMLTGVLWPVIESTISSGRRGRSLRAATGRFNIVWSSATIGVMLAMGPAIQQHALLVIAAVGVVHLVSIAWAVRLPAVPEPPMLGQEHEPHPPVYRRLLSVTRLLLPASYGVIAAVASGLPTVIDRLGVAPVAWQTPIASIWMIVRLGGFAALERWHGWHGCWWPVVVGGAGLIAGLGLTVLAPDLAGGHRGLVVLLIGLVVLGGATALVYVTALYYAMEVGSARIDAGGVHEGLIGVGMTAGPGCGVIATLIVPASAHARGGVQAVVLGMISGLTVVVVLVALVRGRRLVAGSGVNRARTNR